MQGEPLVIRSRPQAERNSPPRILGQGYSSENVVSSQYITTGTVPQRQGTPIMTQRVVTTQEALGTNYYYSGAYTQGMNSTYVQNSEPRVILGTSASGTSTPIRLQNGLGAALSSHRPSETQLVSVVHQRQESGATYAPTSTELDKEVAALRREVAFLESEVELGRSLNVLLLRKLIHSV